MVDFAWLCTISASVTINQSIIFTISTILTIRQSTIQVVEVGGDAGLAEDGTQGEAVACDAFREVDEVVGGEQVDDVVPFGVMQLEVVETFEVLALLHGEEVVAIDGCVDGDGQSCLSHVVGHGSEGEVAAAERGVDERLSARGREFDDVEFGLVVSRETCRVQEDISDVARQTAGAVRG